MDWDAELIALMADFGGDRGSRGMRICRCSRAQMRCCGACIGATGRGTTRRRSTALVRAAGPELTLGADVMVGFPGETDAEFEETMEMVRALPFGYLHLFPFSPRPATRAWALHADAPVAAEAVKERMAALRALAEEKTRAHRASFVGQRA